MADSISLLILSDIHFACDAEKARRGHEARVVRDAWLRRVLSLYRHYVWLRDPFGHNHLLDHVMNRAGSPDLVVALGDYTCDTAFVGVSDDAACDSARECLGALRHRYGTRFLPVIGDHELGKFSMVGDAGGLRIHSYRRAIDELDLRPFWRHQLGRYVFIGVTSTLLALPIFHLEMLPEERAEWERLRTEHCQSIIKAFAELGAQDRVLLFCHDPTALPFLLELSGVAGRLRQVERTFIGHLHSPLIFWKSRLLAGMPQIGWLGNSVRKMTGALHRAQCWKDFRTVLCPSLAGIELLRDGGFYTADLPASGGDRLTGQFTRHHLARGG